MLSRSDGSRGTDMSERADALAEGVAATSADVASRAGIAERLPIEADLWRFYRLHP